MQVAEQACTLNRQVVSDGAAGELSWLPVDAAPEHNGQGATTLRSTPFRLRHVVSQLFLEAQVGTRGDAGPLEAGTSPALCEASLTLAPGATTSRCGSVPPPPPPRRCAPSGEQG